MVVKRFRASPPWHHAQACLPYFKCVCFTIRRRFDDMVRFFRRVSSVRSRRVFTIILAFAFLLGLLFGAITALYAGPSALSMMRTAVYGRVSIVGLLSVTLLPLLLSAFAVYISQYWLIPVIAFIDAFTFGYHSILLFRLYPGSGWLIQCLLMFAGALSLPVLWYVWLHTASSRRSQLLRCFTAGALAITGIVSIDFYFVAPFLADLLV